MLRTKVIAAATAAAAAAVAAPAFAGAPTPAPAQPVITAPAPVVYSSDWTGAYVGADLGYGHYNNGASSEDGTAYGLHAGYDYQIGNYVLGAEAQYVADDYDGIDSTDRLKARFGYDLGDTLVYATAGGAWVDAAQGGSDSGYTVGLGAEYKVADNVTVGAEYDFDKVSDFNDTGADLDQNSIVARVNYRF